MTKLSGEWTLEENPITFREIEGCNFNKKVEINIYISSKHLYWFV